jgi:DNA-binding LytR/AlgR family response regulator
MPGSGRSVPQADDSGPLADDSFPRWTTHGRLRMATRKVLVTRRVLLRLSDGRRVPVVPEEVFFLEADGDETLVRTRGRRRVRDVRSLAELLARFPAGMFIQVHRARAVNVDRVTEIRRRPGGRDWELRLEPPVNTLVPVARDRLDDLWAAYGEPKEAD